MVAPGVPWSPEKGDIIWINFEPQAGHEIMKPRPALILSPRVYNKKASLAVMCPITSTIRNDSFEVRLPPRMKTTGVILADQVRSLDWNARKARFIEHTPAEIVDDALSKIVALLGIDL